MVRTFCNCCAFIIILNVGVQAQTRLYAIVSATDGHVDSIWHDSQGRIVRLVAHSPDPETNQPQRSERVYEYEQDGPLGLRRIIRNNHAAADVIVTPYFIHVKPAFNAEAGGWERLMIATKDGKPKSMVRELTGNPERATPELLHRDSTVFIWERGKMLGSAHFAWDEGYIPIFTATVSDFDDKQNYNRMLYNGDPELSFVQFANNPRSDQAVFHASEMDGQQGQMTVVGRTTYAYDAKGRVTKAVQAADEADSEGSEVTVRYMY